MFKKLLKIGTLTAAGILIYKAVEKHYDNSIEVEPIQATDIIEMLKDKGIKILMGYDQMVIHFISEDKSTAIKARLNEHNEVYLIEFYSEADGISSFEIIYPQNIVLSDEESQKAYAGFRRLIGSVGTSEDRFLLLIREIIENPHLADLSI